MQVSTAVKRAAGFAPSFPLHAEVTAVTEQGLVTARAGSYTSAGALARAKAAL